MRSQSIDTPLEVEAVLIRRFQELGPRGRLEAALALGEDLDRLALAGVRLRHRHRLDVREEQLRVFALRLDRESMIRAYHWDPAGGGP